MSYEIKKQVKKEVLTIFEDTKKEQIDEFKKEILKITSSQLTSISYKKY